MNRLATWSFINKYSIIGCRLPIENIFGITVCRWPILKATLEVFLDNVEIIVQAITCLQNYCLIAQEGQLSHQQNYKFVTRQMTDGVLVQGNWRSSDGCDLDQLKCTRDGNPALVAKENLDQMAEFFMTNGQVPWQWNVVLTSEQYVICHWDKYLLLRCRLT